MHHIKRSIFIYQNNAKWQNKPVKLFDYLSMNVSMNSIYDYNDSINTVFSIFKK